MVWDKWFSMCCFKQGRGPRGEKSPSRDGDGEISPPLKVTGTGTRIFYPAGTGMVS
jgi:hypothetical protein